MKHISKLATTLNQFLSWSKPRTECFSEMLLGLFVTQTVNLTKISCFFSGPACNPSKYRHVQRFFSDFTFDRNCVSQFIFRLFGLNQVYLSMDRTNWKWGKAHINTLVLAVVCKGTALPLYWKLLNSAGNSDTKKRIEVIDWFVKLFGKDAILGVLGDREFVGKQWFKYLEKQSIPFYIRIKNNAITTNARGLEVDISALFYGMAVGETKALRGKRKIYGNSLYLSGLRLKDEWLIVATNKATGEAIKIYGKRWEIETLFGCQKGRGFNFEDTHMVDRAKIEKLMTLLAIGFSWAQKTGEWRIEHRA